MVAAVAAEQNGGNKTAQSGESLLGRVMTADRLIKAAGYAGRRGRWLSPNRSVKPFS
jgi:hypothetical protein